MGASNQYLLNTVTTIFPSSFVRASDVNTLSPLFNIIPIPPKFLLLYDIALQGFNQGKPSYKTFSFNFFLIVLVN